MEQKRLISLAIIFFNSISLLAQKPSKPFPQHTSYFTGTIKPNHITQTTVDKSVTDFYTQWKNHYIKTTPGKNESFVWFDEKEKKQCVSEGQGYGMVIVVLMAGFDPHAKTTFDNLYRYYLAHPSNRGSHLMAWAQDIHGKNIDKTSATDGDMDIAYSLLLANAQWGSKGEVDYLKKAKLMIADIMHYEINHNTWSILLSDGVEDESEDYNDMRSSDFMPSNFKAFAAATNDMRWTKVIDNNYRLFNHMQDEYSADAGLVPDFIVHINKKARPAPPHYLESAYDGCYNYNACRVPWRIGLDYLLTGDKRSKTFVQKINHWVKETTSNNTYNLSAGYTLAGDDIKGRYFEALSFITPFSVSAMVDQKNQQWVNGIWDYTMQFKMKDFDYYDNTVKLLNLIIISGNYWMPGIRLK
jgi:endo-1,4-beta-D-glucanase Y